MIRLHWWKGPPRNLGDALMPIIVERLSGQRVEWAPIAEANMLAGGSILQIAQGTPPRPHTPVWGAGFIETGLPWSGPELDWCAVRGQCSAARLPAPNMPALGDPGLLASKVIRPAPRHGQVVVLPHFADSTDRFRPIVAGLLPHHDDGDLLYLDPTGDPVQTCELIGAAAMVISSSLHGLVVAHSYGVPTIWAPSKAVIGNGWKFTDYASAYYAPPDLTECWAPDDGEVDRICHALLDAAPFDIEGSP